MILGFAGTRGKLPPAQRAALESFLRAQFGAPPPSEVHHGDCRGADESCHVLALTVWGGRTKRVVHPPDNPALRAWCAGEAELPPKPYRERNRDIIDAADVLLACPAGPEGEHPRSGTWQTVRMARRVGTPVWLVWPDGKVTSEHEVPF